MSRKSIPARSGCGSTGDRLWHPRSRSAPSAGPARGFGWFDPTRPRAPAHRLVLLDALPGFWTRLATGED
jgi:hypothetical protein